MPWFQAVLIIGFMVTVFEVNGAYQLVRYQQAANWHWLTAWGLIWLWVVAIFWHLITGEWRQGDLEAWNADYLSSIRNPMPTFAISQTEKSVIVVATNNGPA